MAAEGGILGLVPETIACVTQRLSYADLGRLLLVGDPRLNALLRRNGSVRGLEVVLKCERSEEFVVWPQLLDPLLEHLYSLQLSWTRTFNGFTVYNTLLTGFEWLKLPQTLTRLHLRGKCPLWTASNFNLRQTLPNLLDLDLSIILNDSYADWFATMPPTLTSLAIDQLEIWDALPSSLTLLSIRKHRKSNREIGLPPKLLSLSVTGAHNATLRDVLACTFPAGLESLILTLDSFKNLEFSFPALPASLKTLQLKQLSFWDTVPSLPSQLTSVHMHAVKSLEVVSSLPSTLTDLILTDFMPVTGSIAPSDFFAALPRKLRELAITCIDSEDDKGWLLDEKLDMPPNLQVLLANSCYFSSTSLHCIPPSITDLQLYTVDSQLQSIPEWPLLKSLDASTFPIKFSLLRQIAEECPFIEYIWLEDEGFDLEDSSSNASSDDPSNIRIFSDAEKKKSNDMTKEEENPIRFVSKTLRHLELFYAPFLNDEILSSLPPTMMFFSTSHFEALTNLGIQYLQNCPNMQTLCVGNAPNITGDCFKWLPRSLTRLEATKMTEVEDHHISDLPRNLTHLFLDNATKLTDRCSAFLPRRLKWVDLAENRLITTEILKSLPVFQGPLASEACFKTANFRFVHACLATTEPNTTQ
jgi:hypothetical protein